MHQLDFIDILESEPLKCSCGNTPKLETINSGVGELYSYQCECGMWQGGNGGSFVAYKSPEQALKDWNRPNKRKFNKWANWKRPEQIGQIELEDYLTRKE